MSVRFAVMPRCLAGRGESGRDRENTRLPGLIPVSPVDSCDQRDPPVPYLYGVDAAFM
jgi:hypothetical protein